MDSMLLADLYIPAHIESNLIASRFSSRFSVCIHPGVTQWSKSFLNEHLNIILEKKRLDLLFENHTNHKKFKYRSGIIKKLTQSYQKIESNHDESNLSYHDRSKIDRLKEWVGYKSHWIVPTLNDLPIRFFDALVTGGIPIVPKSLMTYLEHLKVPSEFYETYDLADIEGPNVIVQKVVNKFDNEGEQGIMQRYRFVIDNFHAENTLQKVIIETKKRLWSQC
jgi:hypothetical protein